MANLNNNQNIFEKIDNYFYTKKSSEATIAMAGILIMAGFISYQFVYPLTDSTLSRTQSSVTNVQQKVNTEKNYLNTHTNSILQALKNDLVRKNRVLENTIYKISYVDSTLTELSYLLFNDKNWAKFVDNISELAKKYDVDIQMIKNKFFEPTFQKISHVVEIDISSKAKFNNVIKFLNAIEESKLVIDVHEINMEKPDHMLDSNFKIAVWGMKY